MDVNNEKRKRNIERKTEIYIYIYNVCVFVLR